VREHIISERVVAALQVGNAIDSRRMGPELADLLYFSGPIQVIRALAPSPGIPTPGNHEILIHAAKDVLMKFESVVVEAGKKV
jgi:hypothetical protein